MLESLTVFQTSIMIFILQFIWIGLRTLNVIYTTQYDIWGVIWTGFIISGCWLITITVGVTAMEENETSTLICYVVGGNLGAVTSLILKKYKYI
jgi:hypothetical protein